MPAAPVFSIPYENYIGAILGGQFRLGPLIRQESDGDVYSVDSFSESTRPLGALTRRESDVCLEDFCPELIWNLEAKAYTLSALQISQRKPTKSLGQRLCSIDQAGKTFIVYQVEGQRPYHIANVGKKSSKLPTMKAANSSQSKDVPEMKKNKHRNRGLKKAKVPRFATLWELESFLAIMGSRLTIQQRKFSAEKSVMDTRLYSITGKWEQNQRARHKKFGKTTAAMQRQYDTLSSRFFRARKQWEDWQTLYAEIFDEVERWLCDVEFLPSTLWQTLPFSARSNKNHSKPLPQLLDYYQVFDFEDLSELVRERIKDFKMVLNGEEKS